MRQNSAGTPKLFVMVVSFFSKACFGKRSRDFERVDRGEPAVFGIKARPYSDHVPIAHQELVFQLFSPREGAATMLLPECGPVG